MQKNIKIINYVIYLSLFFWLFIDSITGISLSNGGPSFSVPYKFSILIFMIIVILNYNYNYAIFLFFYFSIIIISISVGICHSYSSLFQIFQNDIKLLANIVFYLYFVENLRHKFISYKKIINILVFNFAIFFGNIFLGALGFGYATYDYGIGRKGFFYAGNEIFLVLLVYLYYYLKKYNYKYEKKLGVFIFSLVIGIVIGTKTAILATIIIFFYDYYINLPKKKRFYFFSFLFPSLVCLVILSMNFIVSLPSVSNFVYNTSKIMKETNLINALLSNRLLFVNSNFTLFKNNFSYDRLFFGGNQFYHNKTCEIDILDVFLQSGLIITVIVCLFYFYLIKKSKNKTLYMVNVIVLGISVTAGHVWLNLSGGIFYMLINATPIYSNPNFQQGVSQ